MKRSGAIRELAFEDRAAVMAGVDHLIAKGIADFDVLGVYGSSFGGLLTAWIVSQTTRFKGAVTCLRLR